MKAHKKPIVILDIDQTLFKTKLFKEKLTTKNTLDESEYIELLYFSEKKFIQELVVKRNIMLNIFSSNKELFIKNQSSASNNIGNLKRLKDCLEDYKDYQIYFVDDHLQLLKEAKKLNKEIITIWLQTKDITKEDTNDLINADKIIYKLEELISIIK
jgi:FMN phosphatase YigB (HAD superfamily)